MAQMGDEPLRIKVRRMEKKYLEQLFFQDKYKNNLAKHVVVFIGATVTEVDPRSRHDRKRKWDSVSQLFKERPENLTYTVDMMFIHPLLGTSKVHNMNPDLALARLSRPVPAFSDNVRPICLSRPGLDERPTCPDSSTDKSRVKTHN